MEQPNEQQQQSADYLLTLERALSANIIGGREALQRAYEAGRAQGKFEGLQIAQEIIGKPI